MPYFDDTILSAIKYRENLIVKYLQYKLLK